MQIEVRKLKKYIDIYDIFRVLMSQDNFKENKISFLDSSLKNKYGKYSIIGINSYLELKEKDNKFYINDKLSDENFEEYLDGFLKENKRENKYNLPLISGGIVVEPYLSVLAADCPLSQHLGFNLISSSIFFLLSPHSHLHLIFRCYVVVILVLGIPSNSSSIR